MFKIEKHTTLSLSPWLYFFLVHKYLTMAIVLIVIAATHSGYAMLMGVGVTRTDERCFTKGLVPKNRWPVVFLNTSYIPWSHGPTDTAA